MRREWRQERTRLQLASCCGSGCLPHAAPSLPQVFDVEFTGTALVKEGGAPARRRWTVARTDAAFAMFDRCVPPSVPVPVHAVPVCARVFVAVFVDVRASCYLWEDAEERR